MPTLPFGVAPLKLQVKRVPLYLPATISPGPDHSPSTVRKKRLSFSDAEAAPDATGSATSAAPSGRRADRKARAIMGHLTGNTGDTKPNFGAFWLMLRLPGYRADHDRAGGKTQARSRQASPFLPFLRTNAVSTARKSPIPGRFSAAKGRGRTVSMAATPI